MADPAEMLVRLDALAEDDVEVALLGRLLALAVDVELAGTEEVDDDGFVDVAEESSLSSWVFLESDARPLVVEGFLCCWVDRPPAESGNER